MARLLIIGGRDTSITKPASLGIDITLFQLPEMLTDSQRILSSHVEVFDFCNLEESVQRSMTMHQRVPFDAVLSFWERGLIVASTIGETLGIPSNPIRAVSLTRDKIRMRTEINDLDFNRIRFQPAASFHDVRDFLVSLNWRGLVKPSLGSGSSGVYSFSDETSARRAFIAASEVLGPFIVEEYIEGDEVSVESLTIDGEHRMLAITSKDTTGPPRFIEMGHQLPSKLPSPIVEQLLSSTEKLLNRIDHRFGPAHTEYRICKSRGPMLIETQTRIGGDQIWEMVELVTGCDQITATCAGILGLEYSDALPAAKHARIQFIPSESGVVRSIENLQCARDIQGVKRIIINASVGQATGEMKASKDRLGYVLAVGDNHTETATSVSTAIKALRITYAGGELRSE